MAITAIANTGAVGTGSSLTSPSISTQAGDLVVVAASFFNTAPAATPITDNQSNAWTQANSNVQVPGGTTRLIMYYSILTTSSGSHTFTATPLSSTDNGIAVQVFRDTLQSGTLDVSGNGTGTSTTPSPGGLTPTVTNCVIVGAQTHSGSVTSTQASGYTASYINDSTSSAQPIALEYKILTDTSLQTASWTLSSSQDWGALAGVFKPALTIGGVGPMLELIRNGISNEDELI